MTKPLFRQRPVALACLLLVSTPAAWPAPLVLSTVPAGAGAMEPAPNVILTIDDSGSMAWDLTNDLDTGNNRKIDLLKSSLIATFGNGSANSGIIPDGRIRLAWQAMHNNGGASGAGSLTPGATNAMRPFSGSHRSNFNTFVTGIKAKNGTPTLDMMKNVYSYARTPEGTNSPWADVPGTAQNTSTNPYLSCRRMYHILLTDGAWNSQDDSDKVSKGDSTTQTLGDGVTSYSVTANATRIYRDAFGDTNSSKASTLSDYAFRNWASDMQDGTGGTSSMANSVRPLIKKSGNEVFSTPTCSAAGTCVTTPEYWNPRNDPATWQHVVQYTIGFGLGTVNWPFRKSSGSTVYYTDTTQYNNSNASGWSSPPKALANAGDISGRATPVDWDTNNPGNDTYGGDLPRIVQGELAWPDVYSYDTSPNDAQQDMRAIELWHAAINGRGRFYPVKTAAGLTAAFTDIIGTVIKDTSVPLVSIAADSGFLRAGMSAYVAGYSAVRYSGALAARAVDASTGAIQGTETWNAANLLDGLSAAQLANRVVLSANNGSGIVFKTYSSLPAAMQTPLNKNSGGTVDNNGQKRVDYVRGDRSNEQAAGGIFRDRDSRLGDIVNSSVWYTGRPGGSSSAAGFGSFASAYANRTPMLYVGANDGMLHGFAADTGVEKLAYIPQGLAQGTLRNLTDSSYNHLYYVDGQPFTGDAYLSNASAWKTVLVGSSGLGGKGWFVLDVTDPGAFTEANASNLVLADTSASTDADFGHIVSPPVMDDSIANKSRQIVKLNNGRWAAVMGNGVNSANEAPVLIVQYLDGDKSVRKLSPCVQPIASNACSFKGSNGLSAPALVDLNGDGTADVAYAGDLQGQLWKFNLSGSSDTSWGAAFGGQPYFVAKRSGVAQPITTAPFWMAHPSGGLMIAFGTGRNLTDADQSSTAQQSLYAVWDTSTFSVSGGTLSLTDAAVVNTPASPALSKLVQQSYNGTPVASDGSNYYASSSNTVNYASVDANGNRQVFGWYLDWPMSGQRVLSNIRAFAGQKILVQSTIPKAASVNANGESCSPAATAARNFTSVLNLFTGAVPAASPFSYTINVAGNPNLTMVETPAGQSALLRSDTRIKQLNSNCPVGQVCNARDLSPGATLGARANWRQILQ